MSDVNHCEVMTEVKKYFEIAASGCDYIMSGGYSLHDDIISENIHALTETTHETGIYPL
jgi:hypothetical protein